MPRLAAHRTPQDPFANPIPTHPPNCFGDPLMSTREQEAQKLQKEWSESARWRGVKRGYTAEDVVRLRGSLQVEHTLARRGSEKLWKLLHEEPFVNSLG